MNDREGCEEIAVENVCPIWRRYLGNGTDRIVQRWDEDESCQIEFMGWRMWMCMVGGGKKARDFLDGLLSGSWLEDVSDRAHCCIGFSSSSSSIPTPSQCSTAVYLLSTLSVLLALPSRC